MKIFDRNTLVRENSAHSMFYGRWYIHDRRAHSGKVYLHDRPANRQRMRMGYIHDGRVNYIREFYLHDRPANRQRTRMGYIHDGRVNYIREFYLHDRLFQFFLKFVECIKLVPFVHFENINRLRHHTKCAKYCVNEKKASKARKTLI